MESSNIHAIVWCSIYAIIGLLTFEWAWSQIKSVREVNEERDTKYPAFRRYDAINWKKWKFYPGAIILMPLRFILMVLVLLLCYTLTRIFTIGHNLRAGPLVGRKAKVLLRCYQFCSWALMQSLSMRSRHRKIDVDYSEYLGRDYKETQKIPERISTMVSNHLSWVDT
jgi:hypothetical protein